MSCTAKYTPHKTEQRQMFPPLSSKTDAHSVTDQYNRAQPFRMQSQSMEQMNSVGEFTRSVNRQKTEKYCMAFFNSSQHAKHT